MGKELLLEIGTEEIPADFLPKALKDMEEIIGREFAQARIRHGVVKTLATPRRLVLCVEDVAEQQEDQVIEKLGPAKRVSYDEGNPTKAALGFAKSQGIDISEVGTVVTEKGEYICVRKVIKGEETAASLPDILKRFILSIPFQKSMRWMNLDIRFARPIHWILALYGGKVVAFKLGNISSGNKSYGHRFMNPGPFEVEGFSDYMRQALDRYVVVDPEERRAIIVAATDKAAKTVSGRVLRNDVLLEEVNYLVEYPSAVCGSFDAEFLELPEDVLITSMVGHQKYFPVVDDKDKLLPHFIAVNNTLVRNPEVVIKGNEKVLRARLSDAKFFFREDRKIPLEEHFEKLKKVVFHSLLGTSYEKVGRFRKLAGLIAEKVDPGLKEHVDRAAHLAKADLETRMVYEFPDLQGVMGREYALLAGENPVVAQAIYEHYLPTSAGGKLPQSDEGSIVSIADKVDTICGFFGVNQIPTGAADPYALRRQALGVINIILNKGYPLSLDNLVDESLAILADRLKRPCEEVKRDVLEFFKGRLENQLITQGYSYDVVDAVLSAGFHDLVKTVKKVKAMEDFKKRPDFEPLGIAFKRVCNIIKGFENGRVDTSLFTQREEEALYQAYLETKDRAGTFIDKDEYEEALRELAGMRKFVDEFFEAVLVMAEDEAVRFNRLSLLEAISKLFYRIADFSKIVTG
ncbi:MAG: glycine--tRNA ligase subunit beta [Syntrophobacterales bacterium]|nr:glycine--tRNA ligase subunit beta [Syntrophobacterales bacterium]